MPKRKNTSTPAVKKILIANLKGLPPVGPMKFGPTPLAISLLIQITEVIQKSPLDQTDARAALEAAIAMIPVMGLKQRPIGEYH